VIAALLQQWQLLLAIFAVALGYGEFSAYCVGRISRRTAVTIGGFVVILLVMALYATSPPSQLGPIEAVVYLLVSIWVVAVPLAIIGFIARRLAGADPLIWKHVGLVVVSLLAAGIWPIFGLFSICTVGVGCDL
jgi:hypothetical protein